jgi:hypothetical protein
MTTYTINSYVGSAIPAIRQLRRSKVLFPFDFFMLFSGSLINIYAYGSLLPLLFAPIFLLIGRLTLWIARINGFFERRVLLRIFSIGWLMAGIAAIYCNIFLDTQQLHLDPGVFFKITTSGETEQFSFLQIQAIYENALSVVIWRELYNLVAALGFERERYIGVLFNVLIMAFTGVIAIRMCHWIYGVDVQRSRLMVVLFSSCGLFWMFSAIHIRDAMVLFSVTTLVAVWVKFLIKPNFGLTFLSIIIATLGGTLIFGFLRREFMFIPGALVCAGVLAILLSKNSRSNRREALALATCTLVVVVALAANYSDIIFLALSDGNETYSNLSELESTSGSLGMKLIYNQPFFIRLLAGTIYIFTFPIPLWHGFQLQSAYQLFKSLNVIFFYALIPLLLIAIGQIWEQGRRTSQVHLFLLFVSIGFTLAIAGTSLENRHFGAFLVPIFLLALLPNLTDLKIIRKYWRLLKLMLIGVFGVHILWLMLKMW